MIVLFIIFAAWIGLGWLGAAYVYNYNQSNWPNLAAEDEARDALFFWWTSTGPIFLLVVLFQGTTCYGPRFIRYKYINGVRQP